MKSPSPEGQGDLYQALNQVRPRNETCVLLFVGFLGQARKPTRAPYRRPKRCHIMQQARETDPPHFSVEGTMLRLLHRKRVLTPFLDHSFLKTDVSMPGIISAMNARPGAAKTRAPAQCHPQTSIAPKKDPIVIGRANLSKNAAKTAATAQPYPRWCSIPTYPAHNCRRP